MFVNSNASAAAPGANPTATFAISTTSTSNASSYATGSFSPASGDLLVVTVVATGTVAAGTVTDSTSEETFSKVTSTLKNSGADTIYLFVGNAKTSSTTSRTITFDCTGDAATGAVVTVTRVANMNSVGVGAVAQFAVETNQAAGTPAPVFGTSVNTNDAVIGVVGNATNPATLTAPAGFTEDSDNGYATPTTGQESVHINGGFTGTTVTWGSSSASAFGDIVAAMTHDTVVACGNTGPQTGTLGLDPNSVVGPSACVPAANSTVRSCVTITGFDSGSLHISCGVYATSAGLPTGSPLCNSGSVAAPTAGTYVIPLTGCGTLSSGSTYAIIIGNDVGGDLAVQASSSAVHGAFQLSITFPTFPTGGTWSTEDGAGSAQFAVAYLNIAQ